MKITAVDHITINCRDLEASLQFYGKLLGLEKLNEVDLGDHVLYYYRLPGTRLELISYKNPQKSWETGNTDVGIYRHIALETDDLDVLYQSCISVGRPINLPPTMIPELGKRVMLAVDPNGVEIELIQQDS